MVYLHFLTIALLYRCKKTKLHKNLGRSKLLLHICRPKTLIIQHSVYRGKKILGPSKQLSFNFVLSSPQSKASSPQSKASSPQSKASSPKVRQARPKERQVCPKVRQVRPKVRQVRPKERQARPKVRQKKKLPKLATSLLNQSEFHHFLSLNFLITLSLVNSSLSFSSNALVMVVVRSSYIGMVMFCKALARFCVFLMLLASR